MKLNSILITINYRIDLDSLVNVNIQKIKSSHVNLLEISFLSQTRNLTFHTKNVQEWREHLMEVGNEFLFVT